MANHSSTKKAIRKTERTTAVNKNRKSRIKTYIKKVLEAVNAGSVEEAKKALIVAQSEIMRGAACNLIQKNTAARKVSRLSARVKNIGLNPQPVKAAASAKSKNAAVTKKASLAKSDSIKKNKEVSNSLPDTSKDKSVE